MKRSVLALAILLAGTAAPALAQYYGGPPPGPRYYDDQDEPPPRPRPRYDDRYGGPPPGPPGPRYDDRYGGSPPGPPRGDPYGRPPARDPRYGYACITSRGTCPTRPTPHGAPCRCDIPGFGDKRGVVE